MDAPTLRFEEFTDGWLSKNLGEISRISSGGTPSRSNKSFWGGDIPWVTTAEIKFGLIKNSQEKITAIGLKNSSAKIFPKGTLLMAMYGQGKTRGQVAKLGIDAATNQACAAILLEKDVSQDYVLQYLGHQYENIRSLSNDGGQKNLSSALVKEIPIWLPSIEEQTKIANFLTAVDTKISQLTKKYELLTLYKKGVIQKIFNQELRFKDDEGREFPEWKSMSLAELGDTYNGLTGKTANDFGIGANYITYKQIFDSTKIDTSKFGLVSIEPAECQNVAKYGDLFFTTSSETPNEVGYCSVLLEDVERLYLNSFCFGYRIKSLEIFSPEYAQFMFFSSDVRESIILLAQGSTRYNISKTNFMKIQVPIPVYKEQTKIANFLTAIDDKIKNVKSQLEATKEYKQGLLQQMFV